MLEQKEFINTPMYNALFDLASKLREENVPKVKLNVIGGFALMMRGMRPSDDVTDIDYVGTGLSQKITDMIAQVGLKHRMEAGWINNDGMLTGASMESFELSTGALHFDHAMTIGQIEINVLNAKDLLRMKIIAIDTAMTEMDVTGEFARIKDFTDIQLLMEEEGVSPENLDEEFGEYILCRPETMDLLKEIYIKGPEAASATIDQKTDEFRQRRVGTQLAQRSAYMENLMDDLMSRSKNVEMKENDLNFAKGRDKGLNI